MIPTIACVTVLTLRLPDEIPGRLEDLDFREGFLALLVPDPDVFLYGTGADEKRQGLAEIQAQAERDWSQSDPFDS
jgi:hypothetical protein